MVRAPVNPNKHNIDDGSAVRRAGIDTPTRQRGDGDATSSSKPSELRTFSYSPKKPFNRRKYWRRKTARMKSPDGGYLEHWQYYNSIEQQDGSQNLRYVSSGYDSPACGLWWWAETKGGDVRYRAKGCGDRIFCPACCVYHRDVMAQDASRTLLGAMWGIEANRGISPKSYGLKLICTIPKITSEWIENHPDRYDCLGSLFRAAADLSKTVWGAGVAGVMGMDFAGASDPTAAHYHVNVYLFPAKRVGKPLSYEWDNLRTWIEHGDIGKVQEIWAAKLREYLGSEAPGIDRDKAVLHYGGIRTEQRMRFWLRYLFRSPLFDLWKGWGGRTEAGAVRYSFKGYPGGEGAPALSPTVLQFGKAAITRALDRVAEMPKKFKRIRWFGALSDGQRGKTLKDFGLTKCTDDELAEDDSWQHVEGIHQVVSYTDTGMKLKLKLGTDEFGQNLWGDAFEVLDPDVEYKPQGVPVGKRERWRLEKRDFWEADFGIT